MEELGAPTWTGAFPYARGGCCSVQLGPTAAPFLISVRGDPRYGPEAAPQAWVGVLVSPEGAQLLLGGAGAGSELVASSAGAGLQPGRQETYWLSFDADRRCVKFGLGYPMEQTTALAHTFPGPPPGHERAPALAALFGPSPKLVGLHSPQGPPALPCGTTSARLSRLLREERGSGKPPQVACVTLEGGPLGATPPPRILDVGALTLLGLGRPDALVSTRLPPAAAALYEHLRQPAMDLEWGLAGSGRSLAAAIRHSLATPGALLHAALQAKGAAALAGGDPRQSYIRVGVGHPDGSAPGNPFILEIWPPGHYSPIHNHGNAYGVVRVLHGSITARIYNKHLEAADAAQPLLTLQLARGDLTWFSPTLYQTHQLQCGPGDFCATLQGFQYGPEDAVRWPCMEYRGPAAAVHSFEPVSDFQFGPLREALLAEHAAAQGARGAPATQPLPLPPPSSPCSGAPHGPLPPQSQGLGASEGSEDEEGMFFYQI